MIPLSRSLLGSEELCAIARVLESGRLVQGERVAELEQVIAARVGRSHAVAVSNGTSALQLALRVLGVGPGDDVLVPDLTWPSPGHAVLELGARPVLVDVDPDDWNVSAEALLAARTTRTRAAIVIDQFGCPAASARIARVLRDLPIVVDAACSLGSHDGERACGARGTIATLSFHPRKVVTTGEGGMCLTDDDTLAGRLRELRNHGQVTPGVFGSASGNYRLSELAAALGLAQLQRLDTMLEQRRRLASRYDRELGVLRAQRLPEAARGNHQTYGVLLPEPYSREVVIASLRERGIEAGKLSYALHQLPQFAAAAADAVAAGRSFPHATQIAERGLALPLFPGLRDAEQTHVIESVRAVVTS
ncbi:MAG: DegT/DnrJ/EryC1/StrS family aminotransferase [Polyangiales bacterium]